MTTATVEARPPLLRVPDVCARLNVSRRTLYRMLSEGSLPAVRVRGDWRVDSVELERFIQGDADDDSDVAV